jgi:hypothetical protein
MMKMKMKSLPVSSSSSSEFVLFGYQCRSPIQSHPLTEEEEEITSSFVRSAAIDCSTRCLDLPKPGILKLGRSLFLSVSYLFEYIDSFWILEFGFGFEGIYKYKLCRY